MSRATETMTTENNGDYFKFQMHLDQEAHPRRFLLLSEEVFVYGGETGNLFRLDRLDSSSEMTKTLVRQWDTGALRTIDVSPNQRHVAVGFEDGGTQLYTFDDYDQDSGSTHPFVRLPDLKGDSLLSQSDTLTSPHAEEDMMEGPVSNTPVRQVMFLDDQYVAVASESRVIIWDISERNSLRIFLEKEFDEANEETGCRSLERISESSRVFGALSLDGRMTYWDCTAINPLEWKLIHREPSSCVTIKDNGEILAAPAEERSCRPSFSSGLSCLALPGATFWQWRQVHTSTSKIEVKEIFHDTVPNSHSGTILASTPCGAQGDDDKYWVTVGRDGKVILWENQGGKEPCMKVMVCLVENIEPAPTDVFFYNDTLFVSTADSSILVWNKFYQTFKLGKKSKASLIAASPKNISADGEKISSAAPPKRKRLEKHHPQTDDSEDEDFDFTSKSASNPLVDDEATMGKDEDSNPLDFDSPPKAAMALRSEDDSVGSDDADDDDTVALTHGHTNVHMSELIEPQAPFAPSSTPLDLSRRFLCWNHIGTIVAMQGETRNTVSINFHDAGFRAQPTITFTDTMGLILGTLGEEGALFASDLAEEDDDEDEDLGEIVDGLQMDKTKMALKRSRARSQGKATGSTVYFHRFETFASMRDKDWYLTLPCGERVLGCASGSGWSAVATSRNFLRMFTPGGNQDHMTWLPGRPVTMVGRSRFLAVVYHESSPLSDGTQKLGYILYDAILNRLLAKGSMSCISPKSLLVWVGFSDEDCFMAMDSDGMLSMLTCPEPSALWEWMPMLDTHEQRKEDDDRYWPITVAAGKLTCVPLKNGVKYPNAARRPVTSNVGLRLPFARGPLRETNAHEELYVRANVSLQMKRVVHDSIADGADDEEFDKEYAKLSLTLDKVILKMFAATIEAGKLEKALDLVERLNIEKSFDLAMQLADNHRKLVDMIEIIKDRRFAEPGDFHSDENTREVQMPPSKISPEANQRTKLKRSFEDDAAIKIDRSVRRKGLV